MVDHSHLELDLMPSSCVSEDSNSVLLYINKINLYKYFLKTVLHGSLTSSFLLGIQDPMGHCFPHYALLKLGSSLVCFKTVFINRFIKMHIAMFLCE